MTNKLLLEAGFGTTYYQWGGRELDPNPTREPGPGGRTSLRRSAPGVVSSAMRYRSQSWLNNKTRGSRGTASASYITGSHSMKFGYQGNYWSDDREMHVNNQSAGLQAISLPGLDFFPLSITQYINAYNVNARAMQTSFFAQDQWTINRLTLQGALRCDHPWSWFPEQVEPAGRFFPGATSRAPTASPATTTSRHAWAPPTTCSATARPRSRSASASTCRAPASATWRTTPIRHCASRSVAACASGFGGVGNPCVSRAGSIANFNYNPDCNLTVR